MERLQKNRPRNHIPAEKQQEVIYSISEVAKVGTPRKIEPGRLGKSGHLKTMGGNPKMYCLRMRPTLRRKRTNQQGRTIPLKRVDQYKSRRGGIPKRREVGAIPQDMNLEQEKQTHEKGEPTPNKKAVKASVVWTRPDRETRRRGPTECAALNSCWVVPFILLKGGGGY